MKRIWQYIMFLRTVNIIDFFFLNYFCKKVIRVDNSKIIPYKNSLIDLENGSKIYLVNGDIEIGCDLLKHSKTETRVRLRKDAIWSSNGGCKISYGSTVELLDGALLDSKYFTLNTNSVIIAAKQISIGSDVMMSRNVVIYDSDFHSIMDINNICTNRPKKVILEDHVWVGANSMILKGCKIGADSIISAFSKVTDNVEPKVILHTNSNIHVRELSGTWNRSKPV